MNEKGQTLIIFVILIPIFLMILTFVVDLGLIQKERTKLLSATRIIIAEVYNKITNETDALTKVKELYTKNEIKIDSLFVTYNNQKLKIIIKKKVSGIFGKITDINLYNLEINLTGYKENDKLIIEKG